MNDDQAIARFAEQAADYVVEHHFDGLSIEWQYPVCWQSDCSKGPASDKRGFSKLVEAVGRELRRRGGLELAVSVSGYKDVIDAGYDAAEIGPHVNMINVMTYDYHGFWDGRTGHHSPLYASEGEEGDIEYYNTVRITRYEMFLFRGTLYTYEVCLAFSDLLMYIRT